MEAGDLLARFATRVDDHAEPPLYSTEERYEFLNDAVRQAALRKRLLLDNSTAEVCVYAVDGLDDGYATVTLHSRVLAVRSARWSGSTTPLCLTTLKVMDKDRPDWPSAEASIPTHLIVDRESGKIDLWPAPAENGTLTLAVWRLPLDSEVCESESDEPVVDDVFHIDLIDWMEHLAYLDKDSEKNDPVRAKAAEDRFTAKFGRLPSAREIKLWGIAPARGQRAQFV